MLCLLEAVPLWADHLELTNGDRLSGHLLGMRTGSVAWSIGAGSGQLFIPEQTVHTFEGDSLYALSTIDGNRLVGRIQVKAGHLSVISNSLGEIVLRWDQIAGVEAVDDPARVAQAPAAVGPQPVTKETAAETRGRGDNAPVVGTEQQSDAQPDAIEYAMRRSGYLLRKGASDMTIGLSYAHSKSNLPFVGVPDSRNINLPVDLRLGVTDRVETSVHLPLGWSSVRYDSGTAGYHDSNVGWADVAAGARVMISPEKRNWPEIIAFVQQIFPTGTAPKADNPYKPVLGTGHYRTLAGVSFLKATDPLVLVCSLSYNHPWNSWRKGDYDLGDIFGFTMGTVFAVNHEAALGAEVDWSYERGSRLHGTEAKSPDAEGAMARMWLTYRLATKYLIEPYTRFGLTNNQSDGIEIGVNLIKRF